MLRFALRRNLFRFFQFPPLSLPRPDSPRLLDVKLWMFGVLFLIFATRAFATQVTLQWDANTESNLAGYKVYYGYASRQYNTTSNVAKSTQAVFSGLKDVKLYYFAVTAYSTSGQESGYSNEVIYDLSKVDSDKDGLSDWDEINTYRTDPNRADTDGDGLSDGDEIKIHKTNPLKGDTDGDGFSDGEEVKRGTNPLSHLSFPQTASALFAVNAGGTQYVQLDSTVYQSDTKFSGGGTAKTTAAIAGTKDAALYQSERYGNFSYNIPVEKGDYAVTLKFAEIYWTAAGKRVFNVLIEGKTVISQLDLVAKVGPQVAYDVVIPVTVTDGTLNIVFQTVVNNAKVSAIKVERQETLFALNAGGPAYIDVAGEEYDADARFNGGAVAKTTAAIAGTKDAALYQSERYGNFSYNIPVEKGDYAVTLKFAEIYWTAAGKRVFNVLIEGKTVISQLDLVAKVGPQVAYDVVIPVTVTDGTLNIVFQTVVNNAKVSAISVAAK